MQANRAASVKLQQARTFNFAQGARGREVGCYYLREVAHTTVSHYSVLAS